MFVRLLRDALFCVPLCCCVSLVFVFFCFALICSVLLRLALLCFLCIGLCALFGVALVVICVALLCSALRFSDLLCVASCFELCLSLFALRLFAFLHFPLRRSVFRDFALYGCVVI